MQHGAAYGKIGPTRRYDRYQFEMVALKHDPRAKNDTYVSFRASSLKELLSGIDYYKEKFYRIDYDY